METDEIYNSKSFRFGFDFYPNVQSAEGHEFSSTAAPHCVLVRSDILQKENKRFIEKVLSSIQTDSVKEYSIVCTEHSLHWKEIKKNFPKLQLFISFGFHPSDLGLQTHNLLNRWIYLDDIQLLFTNSLEELEPDPDLKIKFWDQLKKYANH